MYDIKALEEEWKEYKRRQRKPYLLFSLGLLLLSILGFLFFDHIHFPSFSSIQFKHNKSIERKNKQENKVIIDSAFSEIQVRKQVKTMDKVETIKPMLEPIKDETIPTLPVVDNIPILEQPKKIQKRKAYMKVEKKSENVKKRYKKIHLNIIESSSVSAYKDVEKRFMQAHDTDDSLFLAKSYFRRGNYKKSEYWALQTNKVNNHIEESWIIFIKSKIKLGHINEAIEILKNYIKHSNSSKAKELLFRLKH